MSDDKAFPKLEQEFDEVQKTMRLAAAKGNRLRAKAAQIEQREQIQKSFEALVPEVSKLGRRLNSYAIRPRLREPHLASVVAKDPERAAHLFFCGFLEGDFSERSYLPMPIFLAGGFFLKTASGNVLFDPGMGTLAGMRELGVDLAGATDVIIVSHYHPSARFDLHTLLNEFGGYCPGRATEGDTAASDSRRRKRPLFTSRAMIDGRNDHPPALIPSDLKVVDPRLAQASRAWYFTQGQIEEAKTFPAEPRAGSLLIQTFPAYHSEAAPPGQPWDQDGLNGQEVCCFLVQTPDFGILFTGDTEYPQWSDETWNWLSGRVTLLIANMKTIEYLGVDESAHGPAGAQQARAWDKLSLTRNQLGFEGTRRLAARLRPHVLIVRALGLECVVAEDPDTAALRYVPERLAIYREALRELLSAASGRSADAADMVARDIKVIIPGRHEIVVTPRDGLLAFEEHAVVPAFNGTHMASFGDGDQVFATTNRDLTREIQLFIHRLQSDERPFMVIQGESGGGKTVLANAIARELTKAAGVDFGHINQCDLATIETDSAMYGNILFGWRKNLHFNGDEGSPGYLAKEKGVLILNQLEKLPSSESKKFLDLLEAWLYKSKGISEDQKVQVKIIFTTNIDVEMLTNLTPDLKNRLAGKCITLPSLHRLPADERRRELDLFITRWCELSTATLAAAVWTLLHRLDLSNGGYRCLRELLNRAKLLAQSEYGLLASRSTDRPPMVFIEEAFIEQAMKLNGVRCIRKGQDDPHALKGGVPAGLAWLAAIWVSHRCVNKDTYACLTTGSGTSSTAFNKRLTTYRACFESSEAAWAFLAESAAARAALKDGGIPAYIAALNTIAQASELTTGQFKQGDDAGWLAERGRALGNILQGDPVARRGVRAKFDKHLSE